MTKLALSIPGMTGTIAPPLGVPTGGLPTGLKIVNLGLNLAFIAGALLCLFYIVFGGVKWLTSEGDQEKLASARLTIVYAVSGLVLMFISYMIINIVGAFFQVNLLSF